MNALEMAGRAMGAAAEAAAPEYPIQLPPLPRKVMTKTKGIRFYPRKPYKRTRKLGNSITSKVILTTPYVVHVAVGAGVNYAPYVIGGITEQSAIMASKGWWRYPEEIIKSQQEIINAGVTAFFNELINK
jgi:hypothetical protein